LRLEPGSALQCTPAALFWDMLGVPHQQCLSYVVVASSPLPKHSSALNAERTCARCLQPAMVHKTMEHNSQQKCSSASLHLPVYTKVFADQSYCQSQVLTVDQSPGILSRRGGVRSCCLAMPSKPPTPLRLAHTFGLWSLGLPQL